MGLLIPEQYGGCSFRVYSSDDIRETALEMTDVGHKGVSVVFGLLDDLGYLLAAYWEVVLEHSCGLFACLYKGYAHLV